MSRFKTLKDSMGEINVPAHALWGAQTQRAVENFPVSGIPMPAAFIKALAHTKFACAGANFELGLLSENKTQAIQSAAERIIEGELLAQFPLDVFQTGSATSTNMNMNEVLAHLASEMAQESVHPNDDVNMSQSSNDVIPTAIHVAAALALQESLIPQLEHLVRCLHTKIEQVGHITKTGRTHLMDAMPVTFGQEIGGWAVQIERNIERLHDSMKRIVRLPQGGTAVGTGINAHPEFGPLVAAYLATNTAVMFEAMDNPFEGISTQDNAVELSGELNTLAVSMMKIANDLRWMNSGPLAGLGEIALPSLQPGSSIMPGKVNPVIPESVAMVCAQVMGNHVTLTIAGQSGNFQLNVMLPLIAYNLLQSIEILSNAARILADKAIAGFHVNESNIARALEINPILVTALNSVIGYEKGAAIAKEAYQTGEPVIEVAQRHCDLSETELKRLLNPALLTTPN
jgi:fumarate hydratase class II